MDASATFRLRGEIETPRPLLAPGGRVEIAGWCLLEGFPNPPPVRLATAAGTLSLTERKARPDLQERHPAESAAAQCGFVIKGFLPPGVHLARIEAQFPDKSWARFRAYALAVESPSFDAGIETPIAEGIVHERVHVEGWALGPNADIAELSIRYGHQEIPCRLGGARPDVGRLRPDSSHAARSGFTSQLNLSAGRGPLRLRAKFADGSVAIARTAVSVDVPTDENHGSEIDFMATRVGLPRRAVETETPPDANSAKPLNIFFVLYGSFASNSALHVAALANELALTGHRCAVAVPHDIETLGHHTTPAFRGILFADAEKGVSFADGRGPDILHAWTTRENVRQLTESLRARHGCRVVVHLEDNEQQILSLALGVDGSALEKIPAAELARRVPADLAHPHRSRALLESADAVTVITERLREFVPAGLPCLQLWPAADERFFFSQPRPDLFRVILDRTPGEAVLFYHGNVHAANAAEVRELYLAVWQLNQTGCPVTLLRTGLDTVDFLGPLAAEIAPHVISLGQILRHRHLPPLMALADFFVQPGKADAFNDYRFPSKLPEFFALGRPVILPRTNLGSLVRHGVDAYVLANADADGIANAVRELRANPVLALTLARGAAAFAAEHFSWRRSAEALAKLYRSLAVS